MSRKIFILVVAIAISFSTNPASAQQAEKVHHIGYLSVRSAEREKNYFPAFLQGLRELGYVEGKNIIIHLNRER